MVITTKTLFEATLILDKHYLWLDVIVNNYNENLTFIINDLFYSWYLGGFLIILPDLVLSSTFGGMDTGVCFAFGMGDVAG